MNKQLLTHTNPAKKTGPTNGYANKTIVETLTNGFFTVDRKWTVKYWNKSAEKILGVKSDDIVGKNLWVEFAGILPIEFYAVNQKAFIPDVPVHFEEYWGEMGAWFDVITYYCDDILSVSFKSSNHPHAEYPESPVQRLKVLTELYRFVTEITNDSLWEWELAAQEIFWIDGGHKRVFGYQIENALIPQSFWESRIHPDDRVRVLTGLSKIIKAAAASTWEDEYRFLKANGEYAFVHDRGHIIYDEGKATRIIGATQDITEKVELENKLVTEREARQREITDAVFTAQEKERAVIAKELSENLNQILGATKLYLEMATVYEENREIYLTTSCGYISNVMEEIVRISKKLMPPDKITTLVESIHGFIEHMNPTHPLEVKFFDNGIDEKELDEKLQINIFRIFQDQLNNILQQGKSTQVIVYLTRQVNNIVLLILNDGECCDEESTMNIRTRAALYHGTVTTLAKPEEWHEMRVVLPRAIDSQ